jgi:hypothetical protein
MGAASIDVTMGGASTDVSEGGTKFTRSTNVYVPVHTEELYPYASVYIDVDEWRDKPVRHRYVHGGFKTAADSMSQDTDLRFAMYFPPKEQYQGRFFQYIQPVSGNEHIVETPEYADPSYSVGFAVESGAYLVVSNLGKLDFLPASDPNITMFKASAAVAEASRIIANSMYGPHRPYGYAWGGSGGAYKTLACIENTSGVWDGAVPFVHGTPVSLINNFTVQAHALRILRDKLPAIIDAVEPGGSGDMYAGLSDVQRAALLEVTKFGFPPRSWFNYEKIAFGYTGVGASMLGVVTLFDSSYFNGDFWTLPGYLGHDHPESFTGERIVNYQTSITKPITADECRAMGVPLSLSAGQPENASIPAAFTVNSLPAGNLRGASIKFDGGAAAGSTAYVAGVFGNVLSIGYGYGFQGLAMAQPGDPVTIDNSVYLAVQTYHRHQTAPPEYYVYDQYRNQDGTPIYPQRQVQLAPLFNQGSQSGKFDAKIIVVQNLMDEISFSWQADWYRTRVKAAQGNKLNDVYRLWHVDHAMHTPPPAVAPGDPRPALTTHIINYGPVLEQALRDLAAWVELGTEPPASTAYDIVDGQVQVPATAAERMGVQPVVRVTANGGDRADVKVGHEVKFSAVIETPPNAGAVVEAEWDFEGAGDFPVTQPLKNTTSTHVEVQTTYRFSAPGTYFPALRASSHRTGDAQTPYARIQNLGRVRVVVTGP